MTNTLLPLHLLDRFLAMFLLKDTCAASPPGYCEHWCWESTPASLWEPLFIKLGTHLVVDLLDHITVHCLLSEELTSGFHGSCASFHSYPQCMGSNFCISLPITPILLWFKWWVWSVISLCCWCEIPFPNVWSFLGAFRLLSEYLHILHENMTIQFLSCRPRASYMHGKCSTSGLYP